MSPPVTVPVFRDISTVGFVWNGSRATRARIYGAPANFASIVGGEQQSFKVDGAGEITATFTSGDNSLAGVVARFNTAAGATIASARNGGVQLDAAVSIELTTTHIDPNLFAKFGIPSMKRDRGATAQQAISAPVAATPEQEELDCLSEPIAVPAGASRCTVWVKRTYLTGSAAGLMVALIPENTGDLVSGAAALFDYPEPITFEGTLTPEGDDIPVAFQRGYFDIPKLVGGRATAGVLNQPLVATIDPGVAQVRLLVSTCFVESGSTPLPFLPPLVSARISFGAR